MILKKLLPDIDPTTTRLYMYEDVVSQKQQDVKARPKREEILLDTCQYLFECLQRTDEASGVMMSIMTSEQMNEYMRQHMGYTDEDFERMDRDSKKMLEELHKKLFKPSNT